MFLNKIIPAKSFSAYRIQTKYEWKEKVKIKFHHIHLSQFNSKLSSQMVLHRVEGRGEFEERFEKQIKERLGEDGFLTCSNVPCSYTKPET